MVERDGDTLRWNGREASAAAVTRLHERYGRWTGRAALHIAGIGWTIPIDADYGPIRRQLREWFADRPFRSDWGAGRFPPCPRGWAPAAATAWLVTGLTVGAAALAAQGWAAAAAAVLVAGLVPVARSRDRVEIARVGVRIGPPWVRSLGWREVEAIEYRPAGRAVVVWARSAAGSAAASLPAALLPALRARVARLGGVPVRLADPGDVGALYERWLGPAEGLPWGVLVGAALVAVTQPAPWLPLGIGLVAAGGLAGLAAAIRARVTGWGTGAVLWIVLLYTAALALVGAGWRGWLG